MKPELMLLVWSTGLLLVQMLVAATGMFLQVGAMKLFSNRDDMPVITGWGGRAVRAHENMIENLLPFAALVLVAVAVGKTNNMTLLGAQLFFWARLAYAVIYLAGVIYLRTAAWAVSLAGMVLILLQLI